MKARSVPEAHAEILWQESQNICQPIQRPLAEFLSTIVLTSRSSNPPQQNGGSLMVFVHESCMEAMQKHAARDILHEQAGILCGQALIDAGQLYVVLTSALPMETISTSTHFSFHESTWDSMWDQLDSSMIVGWYHTHPGLGIFLSPTDLRTQKNYFAAPWQIAVVMDPVNSQVGFFAGAAGALLSSERSFIYSDI